MTEVKPKWAPCLFSESDLEDVAKLGATVSGPESEVANVRFLQWQYQHNPAGNVVMWLARDKETGELAGSYSVIPVRIKIDNREILASLSLNTMTHPRYRFQGIFTTLAEMTYKSCSELGITLTIGLPNANSYHGFVGALKFTDIGKRSIMAKPLRISNILRYYFPNSMLRSGVSFIAEVFNKINSSISRSNSEGSKAVTIEENEIFDDRFDELWLRSSHQQSNMVVRDNCYLNWRFIACPSRNYKAFTAIKNKKIAGYIVVRASRHSRLGCHVADIVDAIVDINMGEEDIWRALIRNVELWSQQEQVDVITIRLLNQFRIRKYLGNLGYLRVPNILSYGPNAIIVRCHRTQTVNVEQVTNSTNWYFMDGDNDRP